MPLPPNLISRRANRRSRLGNIIMLLASSNDGDVLVAAHALARTLHSAGVDHHDLVKHIEEPSLNDRQIKLIQDEIDQRANIAHDEGFVEGLRRAEAKQSGLDDFHNVDGTPDWRQIALFVQREKLRLPARAQTAQTSEFIEDMMMRARSPFSYAPTQKQHAWLYDLFLKLGGKIT
jgi:hypothetical protein